MRDHAQIRPGRRVSPGFLPVRRRKVKEDRKTGRTKARSAASGSSFWLASHRANHFLEWASGLRMYGTQCGIHAPGAEWDEMEGDLRAFPQRLKPDASHHVADLKQNDTAYLSWAA